MLTSERISELIGQVEELRNAKVADKLDFDFLLYILGDALSFYYDEEGQ